LASLAGMAQNTSSSFADSADPEKIDNLMLLLDLASGFAHRAQAAKDGVQKRQFTSKATAFLDQAAHIASKNELLLFRKAHLLDQIEENPSKARPYYFDAVNQEHDFPRAYNGLGVIDGAAGRYENARDEFLAAIAPDEPLLTRAIGLGNLGEMYVELDDTKAACESWKKAAELGKRNLPGELVLLSEIHSAMCEDIEGRLEPARAKYAHALETGKTRGIDLLNLDTYKNRWHEGRKMCDLAQKLIDLVSKKSESEKTASVVSK
ncbi:MAG TPA: hypothetical protein VI685_21655, partial [Candidatus Angelobacter sp.]